MPTTAFQPSAHGFLFRNGFSSAEIMRELREIMSRVPSWFTSDGTWGLCGGMCFAALDRYFRGERRPSNTSAPHRGSALFHELVVRQKDTVESVGPETIIGYQLLPDEDHLVLPSLGGYTQRHQWPSVRAKIDGGIPTTICLIRVGQSSRKVDDNHQVVVYGYDVSGNDVTLNVYDPNYPGRDDVIVGFTLGQDNSRLDAYQRPGPNPRGFLRVPYDRAEAVITTVPPVQAQDDAYWMWTVLQ